MPPRIDLTGQKHGRLLVIGFSHQNEKRQSFWKCICDCGVLVKTQGYKISSGETSSCGCYAKETRRANWEAKRDKKDYRGQIFGKLKILEAKSRIIGSPMTVVAQCECGTINEYLLNNVKRGHTSSCGCLIKEGNNTSHGLSHHPLYTVWAGIIQRCCDMNSPQYQKYGANGVEICEDWRNKFESFFEWAISNGWEVGKEIDKDIKGNGLLYSPEYCTVVTPSQNSRARKSNVRLQMNGVSKTLIEWAELYNISYKKLHARIKYKKWTLEKSIVEG